MNRLTTLRTVAAAALVVAAAVVAPAQQTAPPATRPAAKPAALARADREFIQTVAKGGMAEVALGELAGRQAKSDEVKKFGRRMVDDHGKANQELTAVRFRLDAGGRLVAGSVNSLFKGLRVAAAQ